MIMTIISGNILGLFDKIIQNKWTLFLQPFLLGTNLDLTFFNSTLI